MSQTGTQINLSVNLDAAQATSIASQLNQQFAEASINSNRVNVNPAPIKASNEQATQLNSTLKQIQITVQRLNIALAKTGKLTLQLNKNAEQFKTPKGKPNQAYKNLVAGFDEAIKASEEAIDKIEKGVAPAIESVQKPAQQTAEVLEDAGEKGKDAAEKTENANRVATGKMKTQIKSLEAIINSFFSPITLLIIGFEAAVKIATYAWQNLTESIQKMTTRGQTAVKVAQQMQKKLDEQAKSAQGLIEKLVQMNKLQSTSIDQKRLAASIISKLNKQYGDLGITIDETTNKYRGLYQAQRKIDQRNKRQQVNSLKKEIAGQRDIVDAALKQALGTGLKLGDKATGGQFFTLAEQLGGTLGAQNANLLAQKWNTGDVVKQLEVIDQLIQGLSSSDRFMKNATQLRDAMQQLVDFREQLKELTGVDAEIVDANDRLANTFKQQRDALKSAREQVENLQKAYQDTQRANQLAKLDPEDRVKAIKDEVKALEDRNIQLKKSIDTQEQQTKYKRMNAAVNRVNLQRLQEEQKAAQDRIDQLEKKRDQLAKRVALAKQKMDDSYVDTDPRTAKEIRQFQKQQKERRTQNYNALLGQQDTNNNQLRAAQKQLAALKQQAKKFESNYAETNQIALEADQNIVKLEKERQQNLSAIQQKQQQIAQLEEQIEEAKRRQAEEQQKRIDSYNEYVASLYNKQIKDLDELLGKKKQSLLLETKLNAEKRLGRQLTEDQLDTLRNYVELDSLLNEFRDNQKLNIGRQNVITNELASKGGYASSIVVDRSVDINQQILQVQKSQQSLMSKINEKIDKYSVIQ